MKTSLILTVLNEEKAVRKFLDSVVSQTRLPDEVVLVDGGSEDKTVEVAKDFALSHKRIVWKVISKKGNRSVGRNEAIKHASFDIILCTDAGCILDKNWVKYITTPFKDPKVSVVAGYYKGIAKTAFQKCLVPYVFVMPDKLTSSFLPASRSMAFRRIVWKKVGGFPENFSHNEDYVFAHKLKENKISIALEKNAVVGWIPRENIWQAGIMFYRFAYGDGEARLLRKKVIFLFARYIIAIACFFFTPTLFFIGSVSYLLWAIIKNYRYVNDLRAIYFLPLLQITSDLAVMTGTALGRIASYKKY